jgi:hypothetical protein
MSIKKIMFVFLSLINKGEIHEETRKKIEGEGREKRKERERERERNDHPLASNQ